ncbi:hypothetical protein [Brucella pituitosa]|uniref:Uncharacterized protein n=1 Tax=Brucella pituitosa TaxID=571256 RepID=A0ABS3JY08_9HYPH|nr:hypothetical protein [Brucella pituitosa]MBO1038466.1 hypothetical protein [Brucella pituitosa]
MAEPFPQSKAQIAPALAPVAHPLRILRSAEKFRRATAIAGADKINLAYYCYNAKDLKL